MDFVIGSVRRRGTSTNLRLKFATISPKLERKRKAAPELFSARRSCCGCRFREGEKSLISPIKTIHHSADTPLQSSDRESYFSCGQWRGRSHRSSIIYSRQPVVSSGGTGGAISHRGRLINRPYPALHQTPGELPPSPSLSPLPLETPSVCTIHLHRLCPVHRFNSCMFPTAHCSDVYY